jgi:DNA-binding MarR family transcriptional regulator
VPHEDVLLPPGDPGPLEDALSHLQCVVVARRTKASPLNVTWAQYDVLETLRIHRSLTPSHLSRTMGVSRQSMSKALRILKDRGLVQQVASGPDRRELTTTLTDAGREFLSRAAVMRREAAAVAAEVLTPGEQSLFAELCQKVAGALYDHDGGAALKRGAAPGWDD